MTRHRFLWVVLFGLFLVFSRDASADGMILTGTALRTKSIGFVNYKLYSIQHYMAEKPATKSKQAVIDADVNKQFVWTLRNDLPTEKVVKALREAFQMNGYGDQGKIGQFLAAFTPEELKEKSTLTISYNAKAQSVTVTVPGGKSATVAGADFMKAVWSIWFGKIDQPSIGDQLIANL
jgi:hypothetical protein